MIFLFIDSPNQYSNDNNTVSNSELQMLIVNYS